MTVSAKALASSRADLRTFADSDVVRITLDGDQAGWREIMRRFDEPLRQAIVDASIDPANPSDVDDLMGDFWLSLVEADMRRLRAFNPSRGAALLSWLTIQLVQQLRAQEQRRAAEPEIAPLVEAKLVADPNPLPQPRRTTRGTMMRVEDVAERWDLNVKTVYAMIARHELPARRFGRVMRVPRRVVECMEQASVSPERPVKSCR